jgi:hypothetical protein
MMETRLHLDLEILKDLKSSGIRPGKCNELMKDMYMGLPPFLIIEEIVDSFLDLRERRQHVLQNISEKEESST